MICSQCKKRRKRKKKKKRVSARHIQPAWCIVLHRYRWWWSFARKPVAQWHRWLSWNVPTHSGTQIFGRRDYLFVTIILICSFSTRHNASNLEEEGSWIESQIAASIGILSRDILTKTNCSGHRHNCYIDQECHHQSKSTLYEEISTGILQI